MKISKREPEKPKKIKRRKRIRKSIKITSNKCNKLRLLSNRQNKITISLNPLKNRLNFSTYKIKLKPLSLNRIYKKIN